LSLINKKILIVDDEVDLCQVLSWDFEDAGFTVLIANSGNEALQVIKDNQVDILLSDIKMPNGDGLELLTEIKQNKLSISQIYLMTGYTDYPIEELKALGMKSLFKKPIDTEKIIEEIAIND